MRDINRRLTNLEKKLNLGRSRKKPRVLVLLSPDSDVELPENIEDWPPYQEQLRENLNAEFMLFLPDEK